MKRRMMTALATIALVGSVTGGSAYAVAMDERGVSGGWSETTGYYIDGVSGTADTYTFGTPVVSNLKITTVGSTPSKTPDKHTGRRLTKIINSAGDAKYAAQGETLWYYKYHYTTAQMELSNGTVKTTSGRQWDENATKATSPYYLPGLFENTEARTYWGS